jgi:rare lipoprotein A
MILNTLKTCSSLGLALVGLLGVSMQPAKANSCTVASYYGIGDGYHGRTTANGERFDAYSNTTAHRYLPFGTRLRVTNQNTGRSVIVRVNDRGPYSGGRGLDLSYSAFAKIGSISSGVADVCYSRV